MPKDFDRNEFYDEDDFDLFKEEKQPKKSKSKKESTGEFKKGKFEPTEFPMSKADMDRYYRENEGLLHSLLKHYQAPTGSAGYEDLLQCAAFGFFKGMSTYSPEKGTKLSTYCYQCADNEVKQFFRTMNSKGRKAIVISIDSEIEGSDGKPMNAIDSLDVPEGGINKRIVNPEEAAEVSSQMDEIRFLMNTILTKTEKRVLELTADDGLTQSEIAELLHMSQANVSKNLVMARVKIRAELKRRNEREEDASA